MGPFYCPNDQEVYLDTAFFRELETRFRGCTGKACDFSKAYVIAHEVGHHVQNLLGILPKVQQAQRAANSRAESNHMQVMVELQADCFAGVWANHAEEQIQVPRSGRHRRGAADRLRDRRRYAAAEKPGPGGAGQLHPRLGRAAQALVLDRLPAGHHQGLQHLRGGEPAVDRGTMPGIDDKRPFVPLKIAVLTVSDTRELADDKSGSTLAERIEKAGHAVAARAIVTDDVEKIREQMRAWIADKGIDVIISTGGTGFTGRDVTPEAVEPLFQKRMDGFSTVFHLVSHAKIGTSTIQSRATAGTAGATFIFCLPGSPGACRDAWDEILVHQLDYRYRPCNFVELMPRLDETMRREKAKGATV